jgi:SagB-type dehydrogenase family enzyme
MSPGDAARLYHRLSSFTFWPGDDLPPPIPHELVVQDFVSLEPHRLPPAWKVYPPGLPTVDLPRDWPGTAPPATTVLAGQAPVPAARPDLVSLSRLLHLSAGVVRIRRSRPPYDHWWTFRAAGSAGGRFPLELYVSAHGVDGLDDGVWWYEPQRHALVRIGPPAMGDAAALVVTGVPWRTGWKYAERGFRHVYWDAGSMLAQTLAVAISGGLAPRLWTHLPDAGVTALVGADGVQEWPVAVVGLGPGEPAIRPAGDATSGSLGDEPREFPLVTLVQHAGDGDALGDAWRDAAPLPDPAPSSDNLDAIVLRRGSARRLDPTASVPRDAFRFLVAAALRGARTPHVLAVHAADGVEPGLYRWPELDRSVRAGNLRAELLSVCWDQDLGGDASFVTIGAVDLAVADDRGYREAQLDAGIVSGRLHLAAYALGLGASGMAFLDDEIEALLARSSRAMRSRAC